MQENNKKVRVYIDGENFTIAWRKAISEERGQRLHENVNWATLANTYLRNQDNEQIDKIWLFSVRYDKTAPSSLPQYNYHKSLKRLGVEPVYGRYKDKEFSCPKCGQSYWGKEEKETDVNIALQIVIDAEDDLYDRAIIISADTDLVPAIRMVKERHPEKEIFVATPPQSSTQGGRAHQLTTVSDKTQSMSFGRVKSNLFRKA